MKRTPAELRIPDDLGIRKWLVLGLDLSLSRERPKKPTRMLPNSSATT